MLNIIKTKIKYNCNFVSNFIQVIKEIVNSKTILFFRWNDSNDRFNRN